MTSVGIPVPAMTGPPEADFRVHHDRSVIILGDLRAPRGSEAGKEQENPASPWRMYTRWLGVTASSVSASGCGTPVRFGQELERRSHSRHRNLVLPPELRHHVRLDQIEE